GGRAAKDLLRHGRAGEQECAEGESASHEAGYPAAPASIAWRSAWYEERTIGPQAALVNPIASPSRWNIANSSGCTKRSTGRWCFEGWRYWPTVSMSTSCARRS